MILDTSFVEDVSREDEGALAKGRDLEREEVPQRLSAMTLYDLYWGVGYVECSAAERDRIDAVLGTKEIYNMTPAVARKAGRIAGRLAREGQPINDPEDEIIGATGLVHDEPVLAKNVDRFDSIPGLEIESY